MMRLNLNEPITLPRWVWAGSNLAAMVMAMIALSDRLGSAPFFQPLLIAGVGIALIGLLIVLVTAFRAHSGK